MAPSLALPPREYSAIVQWMRRVANRDDRPLDLLFVVGPVGSGKSVGVRQAAREAGVRLAEVGSDETELAGTKSVGALRSRKSFAKWTATVRMQHTEPTALLIDDGEAIFASGVTLGEVGDDDGGDGDGGAAPATTAKALVTLAGIHMPVVLIAADTYSSSTLKTLRKTQKGVTHVFMPRPSRSALAALLVHEGAPSLARANAIADEADGDVRRARLALQLELLPVDEEEEEETQQKSSSSSSSSTRFERGRVSSTSSNVFDTLSALLGIEGSFLPNVIVEGMATDADAAQRAFTLTAAARRRLVDRDVGFLRHMMTQHYLAALPADDIDAAAEAANLIAASHASAFRDDMLLVELPTLVHRAQADAGWRPKRRTISFKAAPRRADASDAMQRKVMAALEQRELRARYAAGTLASADAELGTARRSRAASTFRGNDVYDAVCALAALDPLPADGSALFSTSQHLEALERLSAPLSSPWAKPAALESVTVSTTTTTPRKTRKRPAPSMRR